MTECVIRDFPGHVGQDVVIRGWVSNRRSSGKLSFLIIRDGSGICQTIAEREVLGEEVYAEIKKIPLESSLVIHGRVKEEQRSAGDTR
jgi:asparaginyl-tRNA synthetase